MSQLKLTADGGGGTVAIKGPASTTGNNAFELTVPGTASGTILTSNSSVGKILQVVQHSFTTETSSTSITDVSIGGSSKALTLSSSSNSVLIIASIYCRWYRAYSGQGMSLTLRKTVSGGSITDIYEPKGHGFMAFDDTSQLSGHDMRTMQTLVHIDSPGNTGVTYELYGRGYTTSNSGSWAVNRTDNGDTARSQIVFMEIAA